PKLKLQLSESIEPFFHTELALAMNGAEAVVLGVSSAGVGWAAGALAGFALSGLPLLMISKGLVWTRTGFQILPDAFAEALPAELKNVVQPVAVAGPCIAGELARRVQ